MSSISGVVDFTGALAGGETCSWTEAPLLHDPATGLVVALDGRIDGTRELKSACAAAGHPQLGEGDAELVLRAYQIWEERCPAYILGEYAFAIWDQPQQRLFCARDSGGVRPLFYTLLPDGTFRFATNASQILAARDVPRMLDTAGLVDFLISRSAFLPDRSPCRSVQRLAAAHALTLDRSGLRIARYWSLHEVPANRFSNQTEAVEACAEALQAAVRDRVQGARRSGISLSGGWDSGAVFAVLQSMRGRDPSLPEPWFYTYYGDSPEADERAEVRELLRRWPAAGEFVHLEAGGGLDGLDRHCDRLGLPEPASGWRWTGECAIAARAAGVTHILTGDAGNEVFQSSVLRPADLLRSGRIRDAYRQVQAWSRDAETPVRSVLWPFVVRPALAAWAPNAIRSARAAFGRRSSVLAYLTDSSRELARDLIAQVSARNRLQLRGRPISSWDKRIALDRWCNDLFPMPAGPELDGATLTTPYLDRRVVISALAALDLEGSGGSTRQLLASTVEHASGVPFRGRHAHYSDLLDQMLRSALEKGNDLFGASRLVELGVVDSNRLREYAECFRARKAAGLGLLWRLVSAEAWARRFIT